MEVYPPLRVNRLSTSRRPRRRKIRTFLFSIYFFEISYRNCISPRRLNALFRSRPTANYEGGRRCARILWLHVSRICIESRHNEADYRKIVHEYLESGQEKEGWLVSTPNESRNIVGTRTDFAMTRERERGDERCPLFSTIFEFGRASSKFADNKKGSKSVKSARFCRCFWSFYDPLLESCNGAIPSIQFRG